MTQMAAMHAVKNSTVNQSIKALALRENVGSAKAAKAAKGGMDSSSARSAADVKIEVTQGTATNSTGRLRWGLRQG